MAETQDWPAGLEAFIEGKIQEGMANYEARLAELEQGGSRKKSRSRPSAPQEIEMQVQSNQGHDLIAAEGGGRASRRASRASRASAATIDMDQTPAQKTFEEQDFEETVWETVMLAGLPAVGKLGSLALILCVVANIVIQVVFCVVLRNSLVETPFEATLDAAHRWRYAIGHSWKHVDEYWSSEASRVCAMDEALATSSAQTANLENIELYLGSTLLGTGFGTGHTLACLATFIWCMYLMKDFWRAVHLLDSLAQLPRDDSTHFEQDEHEDGGIVIETISIGRLGFMGFLTLMRVLIALTLGIQGSIWLAGTTEVAEIVLNVAALVFVLDIDELLYFVFIPRQSKTIIRKLKPLEMPVRSVMGVDPPPVVNLLFITGFVLWIHLVCLMPMMKTMGDIQTALCGGQLDFIVGQHPATGLMMSVATHPFYEDYDEECTEEPDENLTCAQRKELYAEGFKYWESVVEELKNQTNGISNDVSVKSRVYEGGRRSFEDHFDESMENMAERVVVCEDMTFKGNDEEVVLSSLQFALGSNGTTCADLKVHCNDEGAKLLRAACPVTCGCRDPRSGQFYTGTLFGCPRDTCEISGEYSDLLQASWLDTPGGTTCSDLSLESLVKSEVFQRMVSKFAEILPPKLKPFARNMSKFGCAPLDDLDAAGKVNTQNLLCGWDKMDFGTLQPFCPVACECDQKSTYQEDTCPLVCNPHAAKAATTTAPPTVLAMR